MDEEMEDNTGEYTFTVIEIDLDYEFDAARYFDFSREESLAEARQAELWFDTTGSYPPSPFVAKLIPLSGVLPQNVNTSPKPKHEEKANLSESDSDMEMDEEVSLLDEDDDDDGKELNTRETAANLQSSNIQKLKNQHQQLPSGLKFYTHMTKDSSKAKSKSSMKPSLSRTSTLMKPTASQMAKQNHPHQMGDARFQKLLVDKNGKNSSSSCGIQIQAAKRQKIEGGHLFKVAETKQQIDFIHKLPKRDGNIEGNAVPAKLRLTIPREPDLETAHRAQRIRPQAFEQAKKLTSTAQRFKALPLNRKILEAPSLLPKRSTPRLPEFREFHLKTSERAMQHISTDSMSSVSCSNPNKELHKSSTYLNAQCKNEGRRNNALDTSKPEECEFSQSFKALPLNKKIFSSKGDIGIFRNIKREITVPMEFNFRTDKRVLQNPPTELFKKLSLASEPQPNAASTLKMQPTSSLNLKGSKENIWNSSQHKHEVKDMKEKPSGNDGKQIPFSSKGRNTDVGSVTGTTRTLGIR